MRMRQLECDWGRTLRWVRLRSLRFAGGEVSLAEEGARADGIAQIASDYVAVVARDRQYSIPFGALIEMTGACRARANERALITLRALVNGWVDDAPFPSDGDFIFWHMFITREGREHRGVVRDVSGRGVELETGRDTFLFIPWDDVGAAVELLE